MTTIGSAALTSTAGVPPDHAAHTADPAHPAAQDPGPGAWGDRMVDSDRYCIDVLAQISTVNRSLAAAAVALGCSMTTSDSASSTRHAFDRGRSEPKLDELATAMRRTSRR